MYLSYMVLKLSTVVEFTISSVKSFHFSIVLIQNECILYDFKALGLFSFLLCPRVSKSEYSNIPSIFTSSMLFHIFVVVVVNGSLHLPKRPEIPERPVNGSTHARERGGSF